VVRERDWDGFIDDFHARRAGITETVLGAATCDDRTPYEWLVGSLPDSRSTVVDVACGSGPLQPLLTPGWIGADLAPDELELARTRPGRTPVLRADLAALPFRTAAVEVITCAMALMVVAAVGPALEELRRVVRVGGTVAVLLPARQPLTMRDRVRYARLLGALRHHTIPFPRPDVIRGPDRLLRSAGFTIRTDEQQAFRYPIVDGDAARSFVDSLYLPATPPTRVDRAARVVARWIGTDIGIPLRRIVATR
jgi:SAM-dependent methyltransferase